MRVLELSDREEAAAFAGKLFRRWGAEVIKVESPRRRPPETAADIYLNGGKRRLGLDIADPADRRVIDELARDADILLTDHSGRDIEAHGILSLGGAGRSLVRTSITPFGLDGPYRDYEATSASLLALGGYTWLMGDPGREPLTMPGNYAFYQAGTYAYLSALAAALARPARPVDIEVSVLECLASLHQFTDTFWTHGGIIRSRHGNRWENLCPTSLLPCADGWYGTNILPQFWFSFAQMIGHPEIAAEGELSTNAGRMEQQDAIEEIITKALWDMPKKQIFKDGQEAWRVPISYAASLADVLADPHLAERSFWRDVSHAGASVQVPGSPFRFVGEEAPAEQPVESRGLSTGAWNAPPLRGQATASPTAGPLEGIRVIDLTRIWSGPLATRILGDLGAEVIKIEAHRGRGPMLPDDPAARSWNNQPLFNKLNRNKKSIALDLKAEAGRSIFLDLVAKSDVVIENFSARAMPSLGLDYDALRAANDQIIYLSMPAFGMQGPYRDYVGLGPSIEPITGLVALMGYGPEEPRVTSKALTDPIAGTTAAAAIVTALWRREETGSGAFIDFSQHEAGVTFIGEHFVEAQLTGHEPERLGNRHADYAPHGIYPCRGDDEWIAIAARDDAEFTALCRVLGLGGVPNDVRFRDNAARRAHDDELAELIYAATAPRGKRELEAALQAAGVPAGSVQRAPEYLDDPHLRAREYFVELEHPEAGSTGWDGSPLRFDGERGYEPWSAAPCLGADNRGLLSTLLGLSDDAVDALYVTGVLAESP